MVQCWYQTVKWWFLNAAAEAESATVVLVKVLTFINEEPGQPEEGSAEMQESGRRVSSMTLQRKEQYARPTSHPPPLSTSTHACTTLGAGSRPRVDLSFIVRRPGGKQRTSAPIFRSEMLGPGSRRSEFSHRHQRTLTLFCFPSTSVLQPSNTSIPACINYSRLRESPAHPPH